MAFGWQLKGAIVALLVLKLPTMPFGQANVNKKRPLTEVEESKSECESEKKSTGLTQPSWDRLVFPSVRGKERGMRIRRVRITRTARDRRGGRKGRERDTFRANADIYFIFFFNLKGHCGKGMLLEELFQKKVQNWTTSWTAGYKQRSLQGSHFTIYDHVTLRG